MALVELLIDYLRIERRPEVRSHSHVADATQMSAEPIDRLTREKHMTVSDVDADVALRHAAHENAALRHAAGQVVAAWHSIYPMLALQHGGTQPFTRLAETMTALQRFT